MLNIKIEELSQGSAGYVRQKLHLFTSLASCLESVLSYTLLN